MPDCIRVCYYSVPRLSRCKSLSRGIWLGLDETTDSTRTTAWEFAPGDGLLLVYRWSIETRSAADQTFIDIARSWKAMLSRAASPAAERKSSRASWLSPQRASCATTSPWSPCVIPERRGDEVERKMPVAADPWKE